MRTKREKESERLKVQQRKCNNVQEFYCVRARKWKCTKLREKEPEKQIVNKYVT